MCGWLTKGRRMRFAHGDGPICKKGRDGPLMTHEAIRRPAAASVALPGTTPLTCADYDKHSELGVSFAAAKGLLMRFGFAPIRGSNPRASAPGQGLCAHGAEPLIQSVIIAASRWPI